MAIKSAMKPGFFGLYFKIFNIKILKDYFNRIYYNDQEDEIFLQNIANTKIKSKI